MLEEFEDMILNKVVQMLNTHGINVNVDTLKKALANSPHIVTQIQSILSASDSKDRIEKIKALISEAAAGENGGSDTGKKSK